MATRKDLVAGDVLQEVQQKIGLIMRNASFFEFAPVEAEKGVFTLSVSVAGKKFLKVLTKLSESNKLTFDKYEIDEVELKAFLEWLDDKYVQVIKETKQNEGLAPSLVEATSLDEKKKCKKKKKPEEDNMEG